MFSYLDPLLIERGAREVVRIEIERRVGEKIDFASSARLVGLAQRALHDTDADILRTQRAIRDEVPRKVANVVANMLDADCECRKRLIKHARISESARMSSLTQVRARLVDLIETAYVSVTRNLMREFRIFAATNAAAFALLGLVTHRRKRATFQLILAAAVLVGAVVLTGGIYLFKQNWLHTILFAQYVGLAYVLYLIGVTLLLADIVFNRARVTTTIVNLALEAIGSVTRAVPC